MSRIGFVMIGGAVLQAEGAQMVLRIELDSDAKARIGKPIEVLEHPENPNIRAIAGYLPNGRKAS